MKKLRIGGPPVYLPWRHEDKLAELVANGQVAAQYCDINGEPTMRPFFNPNYSDLAIEGIFSPDGRILGKMGHSERIGKKEKKNVPGNKDQHIFASGVKYFR
jgi:phosphoribosylformylglycinamidine synthase